MFLGLDLGEWGLLGDTIGGISGPLTLGAVWVAYQGLKRQETNADADQLRERRQVICHINEYDGRGGAGTFGTVDLINGSREIVLVDLLEIEATGEDSTVAWVWLPPPGTSTARFGPMSTSEMEPPRYLLPGEVWTGKGAFRRHKDDGTHDRDQRLVPTGAVGWRLTWTDSMGRKWRRAEGSEVTSLS